MRFRLFLERSVDGALPLGLSAHDQDVADTCFHDDAARHIRAARRAAT